MIIDAIHRIANHREPLSREEARLVMSQVLTGKCTDAQIAAFLVALHMKGETVEEIVGFAEAIRAAAAPIAVNHDRTLDVERYGTRRLGGHLRHWRGRQRHFQYFNRYRPCGRGSRSTRGQARKSQCDFQVWLG